MKTVYKALPIVLAIFLCFCGRANAQCLLGGEADLSFSVTLDPSSNSIFNSVSAGVGPSVGWMIKDKWIVGVKSGVFHSRANRFGQQSNSHTTELSAKLYARYLCFGKNRFGLWVEGNTSGNWTTRHTTADTSNATYKVGILPVISYMINSHLMLQANLNCLEVGATYVTSSNLYSRGELSFTLDGTQKVLESLGKISIGVVYKF